MKKGIISIIIILCIFISIITIYSLYISDKVIKIIEKQEANIEEYTIYGIHLNIKGNINLNTDIKNISIALKNNKEEINYKLNYEQKDNKTTFYLSQYINEGINLENLKCKNYYVLLKINDKYYSLNNNTEYNNSEYYAIKENKKTTITSSKVNNINVFKIKTTKSKKDNNIYDIVIDAGHGGNDTGAIYGSDTEAFYTLEYAISLKENLENLGYKVKLTRDENKYLSPYGENGRSIIPQDVKAKYLISLHLNSLSIKGNIHGVEVYAPYNTNLEFASTIAKNIVEKANTTYSNNTHYKVQDGVYVRTLTLNDVNNAKGSAKEKGYELSRISTNTNYLFIIRETGGIMTGAYVTSNISTYGNNPYYNSNIGVESYLIELGYIIDNTDLNNIKTNKDKYIDSIAKSIDKEIKKAY